MADRETKPFRFDLWVDEFFKHFDLLFLAPAINIITVLTFFKLSDALHWTNWGLAIVGFIALPLGLAYFYRTSQTLAAQAPEKEINIKGIELSAVEQQLHDVQQSAWMKKLKKLFDAVLVFSGFFFMTYMFGKINNVALFEAFSNGQFLTYKGLLFAGLPLLIALGYFYLKPNINSQHHPLLHAEMKVPSQEAAPLVNASSSAAHQVEGTFWMVARKFIRGVGMGVLISFSVMDFMPSVGIYHVPITVIATSLSLIMGIVFAGEEWIKLNFQKKVIEKTNPSSMSTSSEDASPKSKKISDYLTPALMGLGILLSSSFIVRGSFLFNPFDFSLNVNQVSLFFIGLSLALVVAFVQYKGQQYHQAHCEKMREIALSHDNKASAGVLPCTEHQKTVYVITIQCDGHVATRPDESRISRLEV